jgi:hypothetical protein
MPPCPADGGPTWRELTSAHFQLWTDLDEQDAKEIMPTLEWLEAGLLVALHAPPEFRAPRLPVVAIARGWNDFTDRNVEGFFTEALFRPLVVFRGDGDLRFQETIKHELAHAFTRLVVPNQPLWLAEGLATYFETLDVDREQGTVTVGRPAAQRLSMIQKFGLSGVEEMMAAKHKGENPAGFYATAWVTVHYLMNRHAQTFLAYQRLLQQGVPADNAWARAFGPLTPKALALEIRGYLDGGQYELLVFKLPVPPPAPITATAMRDADVHAIRALLLLRGDHLRPAGEQSGAAETAARRELAETLRQDPNHVAGLALRAFELNLPSPPQRAREVTERHGSNWLAWMVLADSLRTTQGDDAARDAFSHARDLARQDVSIVLPGGR